MKRLFQLWKKYGISCLVLVILFGWASAEILLPDQAFSQTENRYLQRLPEFSLKALLDGSYGKKYEAYLSDQFPVRDQLVALKTEAELIQGKEDVNGVYIGKDGYLMERFEREDIETEQMEQNLKDLAGFLEEEGERLGKDRVRGMLVPSASQILKEKLPFLAAPYDQGLVMEKLRGLLESPEQLVDPETVLNEHREEEIYYKTDHHWTMLGAYYGYRAWAESIGLEPYEIGDFSRETVTEEFFGTVQAKVNRKTEPDTMERWSLKKEEGEFQVFYDGSEEAGEMYTQAALEGRDKYRFYLDGNHALTEIRNSSGVSQGRKLCVIKDSYGNSFAPFAACHFDTVFLIDLRYFNGNIREFLEEQGVTDLLVLYRIPGFAAEETIWKL